MIAVAHNRTAVRHAFVIESWLEDEG